MTSHPIKSVRAATNDEWDRYWNNCPYATYYQSREWSDIWKQYSYGKIRPDPLLIELPDNRKVLLPLTYRRYAGGILKRYGLSIPGMIRYGGWLSYDVLPHNQVEILVSYILHTYRNISWRVNPFGENIPLNGSVEYENDATSVIYLSENITGIFARYRKGNKYAIRQGERKGVTVRVGNGIEDWDAYYEMYRDTVRRWGKRALFVYGYRLFKLLAELKSENVRLWLAEYESKPVAGAVCLYSPSGVCYWHGAALGDFLSLRPVNVLDNTIISDAYNKGLKWLDFGISSHLRGVRKFKESFGAVGVPSPLIRQLSLPLRYVRSLWTNVHGFYYKLK